MTINTNLVCELQSAVKVQYLDGNLFSQDVQGNVINVTVLDGGEPATLSGSVSANIIRADGGTVAATGGTFAGNVASITLPAAAYSVPGVVSIVVKITDSGVTTTIAAVVANIYQSSTDTVIDPGTIIPSVQTLIAAIDAAVSSIPADYSSLWSSLAPNYSIIGFPVYTGYLCTNDGHLYRAKGDIPTSETWNSSHWAQVNIGDYIHETKSAFNHSLSVAGENLLSISDFDTPTDSNVTYSVSGGKITITNGSSANYAGLLTSSAFLAKLSTGRMYRFHARCSIDTGNGTPIIAAKAGNNYVNAIYIGVSASTVVDFVVDSNTSAIALMVAFGSSTSGSVVSFDELWVKEMGKDTVARNDIIDLKSALNATEPTPFTDNGATLKPNFGSYNSSFGYFESQDIYLEKGLCLKVETLPSGASAFIRKNNTNIRIYPGYYRYLDNVAVKLRIYTSDSTLDPLTCISLYYDSYQYGKSNEGFIPNEMIKHFYFASGTKIQYMNSRRTSAHIRFRAGDSIKSTGYDMYVGGSWRTAGTEYTFTSDTVAGIVFRDTANTSKDISGDDMSNKIEIISKETNEKKNQILPRIEQLENDDIFANKSSAYGATYTYNSTNQFHSTGLYFKGGEIVKVASLPSGATAFIRIDSVNYRIYGAYIYKGTQKQIELRIYSSDSTIDPNSYISIYLPSYQNKKAEYGFVPNELCLPVYVSGTGKIGSVTHRRMIAPMQFIKDDVIETNKQYAVNLGGNWVTRYKFDADTLTSISIADASNNTKNIISDDLTGAIKIYHEEENTNTLFGHPLKNYPLYEKQIYTSMETGGSQGIASDGAYVYVFNGNGACRKINPDTGEVIHTYTVGDNAGHANGATYCPANGHFYVTPLSDSAKTVAEFTHDLEFVETHDIVDSNGDMISNSANGVYYNTINNKFYVLVTKESKFYVYGSDWSYDSEVSIDYDLTYYVGQGLGGDGVYAYIPTIFSNHAYVPQIIIVDFHGNYVGRRTPMDMVEEIEDIDIDPITGRMYCSYQTEDSGTWGCNIVEYVSQMDEWADLGLVMSSVSENISFGNQKPLFKLDNGTMYIKGLLNASAEASVAFRLLNSFSPKEKKKKSTTVFGNSGGEVQDETIVFGNTTVFTNDTIPVGVLTTGLVDFTCRIDNIDPLYVPHSNKKTS